ncbi:hypothetical protein PRK78_003616 [Emydomyces testavorans]|uniref:Uncharacterized protein n=1 Tax=Emydomyces testavorans TaxID=2070801 RepID=A0AAF0DGC5_9EURO|nr:hypothetical protein PRK78_003616 [Emydomyces testavorans]
MESTQESTLQPPLPQPDSVFSPGRTATRSRRPYQRIPSSENPPDSPQQTSVSAQTPNNETEESSAYGLGLSHLGQAFRDFIDDAFTPRSTSQASISSHASEQTLDSPDHQDDGSHRNTTESQPLCSHRASSTTLVQNTPMLSSREDLDRGNSGDIRCPSRKNVVQRRVSWLSIVVLFLAFYSTAFSGIYLVVACAKPRFGKRIGIQGGITPSTASLLSALFAKTIELSFVTVFVAFLGQVLSRRALAKKSPGISIADMSMRSWIMQPGTLLTHWQTVRYSATNVLGMVALTTAWMAMLYTTAAETLVSPKLRFGPIEGTRLYGQVASKFANPYYLANKCLTPITAEMDSLYAGSTCMDLSHVGQAYHNYEQYIARWGRASRSDNSTSRSLSHRIPPMGTWYDNTTVTGSWIDLQNMTELSKKHGRMVNIVTAAMPHAGVFAASRDPRNSLGQPSDFGGLGEFYISASVSSPAVQVICAGMTEDELNPLIYTKWPNSRKFNASDWLGSQPKDIPTSPDRLNKTVVDELFGFGKKGDQRAPIFPKLPVKYNTIINATGNYPLHSLYLLGASAPSATGAPYVLCALRGGMASQCSTRYHAAASGGQLDAHCEDPQDKLAYRQTAPDSVPFKIDPDWKNVASAWALSLSLGAGIIDANASNSRLLMQLTGGFNNNTKEYTLNPKLPSLAEALAVMAGSTLLMSAEGATFAQTWPHGESPIIEGGKTVYEGFPATIRVSEYASGGTQAWQGIFYVVLVHVFLTSLICLGYMYFDIRGAQVTDFTEPQNIFALALNSPSSIRLHGACGAGPEGRQLGERWRIGMDERDEHYYITSKADLEESMRNRAGDHSDDNVEESPQKSSLSPAVSEYRKLQKSRHSLSVLS